MGSDFELLYFAKVFKVTVGEPYPTLDPLAADPRRPEPEDLQALLILGVLGGYV